MFFPKGAKANFANLKCCLANGSPIMVMAKTIPSRTCVRLIHILPIKNHITFIANEKQPDLLGMSVIFAPKGHSISTASFSVCNPNGMPIIVTIIPTLDITY